MIRPMPRPLLLLLVCLGCATVAKVTQAPAAAVGRLLLPKGEEKRLGDQLAAQVEQQEKILDDPEVQGWTSRVGERIVAAVPEADRHFPFQIKVIDDPQTVNAFALPGGHLFVYSGLIAVADDEAEVASVLAHEVAHVTLDHPSQQLAAQVGVETLRNIALGYQPGILSELATGIAAQGYLAAYSRQDEAAADRYGLSYLANAGYDPDAFATFFEKLEKLQGSRPNAVEQFFASHPSTGDRIASIRSQIQQNGYDGGKTSIVGGFDAVRARVRK